VLDLGCGTGNTGLPLIEKFPRLSYLGIDGSEQAVALLQQDPRFDSQRCQALAADIASPTLSLPANTHDVVLFVFVLSALSPVEQEAAVARAFRSLVPGGRVVLRDYALGDLAESRFKASSRIGRHALARSDGTLTFFFTEAGLDSLLSMQAGFSRLFITKLERIVTNRLTGVEMARYYYSAEFLKTMPDA